MLLIGHWEINVLSSDKSLFLPKLQESPNILGLQLPAIVTQTTRVSTCTCQTVTKIERSRRGSRNTEIPNIKVHCRISS